jgi:hypothetical protein
VPSDPAPDPLDYLKGLLDYNRHEDVARMIEARDHVFRRFRPVFEPARLDSLAEFDFRAFLRFENNRHWWGIDRNADLITANMHALSAALAVLLDETRPIADRIDDLDPPGPVLGLESAVYTAILLVMHPDRYGVWSSISQAAMERLALWPSTPPATTRGGRYAAMNERLLDVAGALGTDLWTLDALWWAVEKQHDPARHFAARRSGSGHAVRPRRQPTTPRAESTSSRSRAKKPETATFVCDTCFQHKPLNLSSSTPGRCIDCAGG